VEGRGELKGGNSRQERQGAGADLG
jgi:hypothetical protein